MPAPKKNKSGNWLAPRRARLRASSHRWQRVEGTRRIDWSAYSIGFCNGPVCLDCGYQCCEHCTCGRNIPQCRKTK